MTSSSPRAHRDRGFLDAKLARIKEPHVALLSELVRSLRREQGRDVPWFDPADGGVNAKALLLFEAPGRRAASDGSGIVSQDNDDGTAQHTWELIRDAGLDRRDLVIWNIVPWYVGTADSIGEVTPALLDEARPALHALLQLLPHLRLVVTVGSKARDGWLRALLDPEFPLLPTLWCPHPSPRSLASRPENRGLALAALNRVRTEIHPEQAEEAES